ncbi:hypothetical protein OS914_01475 [Arthrobacter sp. H14-L1]|nr:hypothetical protein [Arthrobacter sp. H14-L1]
MPRFSLNPPWPAQKRHRLREGRSSSGFRPENGEAGSALVEFVFLAVLLMIPVVYLVITVGQLQAGAYAVAGAADQAAKVYVAAAEPAAARAAAEEAVVLAMADYGFNRGDARLDLRCDRGECASPGSLITATVSLAVPLPLVSSLPGVALTAATVDASTSQVVGRFR